MIALIGVHRAAYGIEPFCKALPTAPSIYHDHRARRADPAKLPARAQRDAAVMPGIARVFAESPVEFWTRFGLMGLHALTAWLLSVPPLVAACYLATRPLLRRLGATTRARSAA